MRIPAPHAIEGYALGLSTAGPSSGVNQYAAAVHHNRNHSLQIWTMGHKLYKITEEELRKRSSEREIKVLKNLVKEGKINNPRFVTEARRKERERLREESTSTTMPVVKEENLKKFLSFPRPHHLITAGASRRLMSPPQFNLW